MLYGSAAGLTAAGNQLWHQDSPGIQDAAEAGDHFGDRRWPRATSTATASTTWRSAFPTRTSGPVSDAGAVNVLYGSAAGLTAADNQFWHQDSTGIDGGRRGGRHLRAAPWRRATSTTTASTTWRSAFLARTSGPSRDAGAVNVLYGSAAAA